MTHGKNDRPGGHRPDRDRGGRAGGDWTGRERDRAGRDWAGRDGIGRDEVGSGRVERPNVNLANLAGMAAAAGQEARAAAARRRMMPVRLTDEERRISLDELAEQFAIGRLDEAELHRRVDLVNEAVTHADLQPAFVGLPLPPLYAQPERKPGRWRWVAFVGAVWMALPFVLLGLVLLLFGREVAAAIFGLPALAWILLTWRWARTGTRPNR